MDCKKEIDDVYYSFPKIIYYFPTMCLYSDFYIENGDTVYIVKDSIVFDGCGKRSSSVCENHYTKLVCKPCDSIYYKDNDTIFYYNTK